MFLWSACLMSLPWCAAGCSLVVLLVAGAAAQTLNPGGYINSDPSRGSVENDAFTAPLQSGQQCPASQLGVFV